MSIDFDRDNNTYNWLTSLNYKVGGTDKSIRSYFNGQSNLIKRGYNRWQENATTGFESNVSLHKRFGLLIDGEYTVNGLDRRRVKTSELTFGMTVKPSRFFQFSPVIRGSIKKRSELEVQLDERGLGYGMRGEVLRSSVAGIDFDGILSYDRINLSNIPWQEGNGILNARTSLWVLDTVTVVLQGTEASKKYYSLGGDSRDITNQIRQERNALFGLKMGLPAQFKLVVDGGAHLSRYLYRQSVSAPEIKTQRDNYGSGENYTATVSGKLLDFIDLSVGYLWSDTREDFIGNELDLETIKGELTFHTSAVPSRRDTISADITFGVTSYSNPNTGATLENRDQKTILFNGGYSHTFSRYFQLGLSGGVNGFHQIYISGARSANNGKNETYILTPFAVWKPAENLSVRQSFDIQANYITFDFDRGRVSTKNRIFRRATSRTEAAVDVSERLTVIQAYQYRYEDYGLLIWDDGWQQAVSWDRRRNGLETRLIYKPLNVLRLTPNLTWEKTGDYYRKFEPGSDLIDPMEIRYLQDEQVKMFFEFEIAFLWDAKRHVTADFSHRVRKFMKRPKENNDYIKVTVEYLF